MAINTGYTAAGLERAFGLTQERFLDMVDELDHLDCHEGENPFSIPMAVFTFAARLLAHQGWTPKELCEHIVSVNEEQITN